MMNFTQQIPPDLINFVLVTLFSLVIGIEQRSYHLDKERGSLFGTDRTFTLIGIWGFILYIISPITLLPFLAGGIILAILLSVFYYLKIKKQNQFGFTSIIIALITYCLTPLVYLQPPWMVLSVVVTVLIFVEIKEGLFNFSRKIGKKEFTTLAKFIIIAGVILPLLSHQPVSQEIDISPYQMWLAIVVVSAISYLSYIIKKFIFPKSGTILTAILGGLYSSTATTVILAKKSKENGETVKTAAGIILATGVMYVRILILAVIFNTAVARNLLPYFFTLILLAAALGLVFLKEKKVDTDHFTFENDKNPLEFKAALIFGVLFSVFVILTNHIINHYGNLGIGILSLIVGVTDIDPYILGLFQNSSQKLGVEIITLAAIVATASNNLLKMVYALVLGHPSIRKKMIWGFSSLAAVSFGFTFFLYL